MCLTISSVMGVCVRSAVVCWLLVTSCRSSSEQYRVYWNMPADPCYRHGYTFPDVESYGFIRNSNGQFKGDKIVLFYSPGAFPLLRRDETADEYVPQNGGIPQKGDLDYHLQLLTDQINGSIPDPDFDGLAVLDFEDWRPTWDLNYDSLAVYKKWARQTARRADPQLDSEEADDRAKFSFEEAAKLFLVETLKTGRRTRPLAKWGYYIYPECDNYVLRDDDRMTCSPGVLTENERYLWMFDESDALYPDIYLWNSINETLRAKFIIGRMEEVHRLLNLLGKPRLIFPYANAVLGRSEEWLSREDLLKSILIPKYCKADGVVMWGASSYFNSEEKCCRFNDYLENVFGPAVQFTVSASVSQMEDFLRQIGEDPTKICK